MIDNLNGICIFIILWFVIGIIFEQILLAKEINKIKKDLKKIL